MAHRGGTLGRDRAALEAVQREAESAPRLARTAASEADDDREASAAAQAASTEAGRRLDNAAAAHAQAEVARAQSAQRLETLAAEHDDICSAHEAALGRLAATEAELASRELELARAEGAELEALAVAEEATRTRTALDDRARSLAALSAELGMRAAGLEERRSLLAARRDEVERRLSGLDTARSDAAARRQALKPLRSRSGALPVSSPASRACSARHGTAFEPSVSSASWRLPRPQPACANCETNGPPQSAGSPAHASSCNAWNWSGPKPSCDRRRPSMRFAASSSANRTRPIAAPCPELPPGIPAQARVRELDRELRLMGPVNPLALEELAALEERDRFLAEQLEDVRNARRELGRVIRAVDEEIVGVFSHAFADVAHHFEELFAMLFPGGSGSLSLVEPEDLLATGVEIEARPAGRNVRRLSLLSGGERSLVALAFLFAVFRSRPSPFYLMDEVEAALDDVNLHRFLDLVDEFRADAQLIIVSHQKRTMEAADVLYGVTMQPGGASKVVSERIDNPSAHRAAVD